VRLVFLGTAAAEGYPAPFCTCPNCQRARELGGRNIRLRSSVLINDDLLIDFCDLVPAAAFCGVELSKVETLLITHNHADHLWAEQFFLHAHPFTRVPVPEMAVYAPRDAIERIRRLSERTPEEARYSLHPVSAGEHWTRGRYHFWAVPSHTFNGRASSLYHSRWREKGLLLNGYGKVSS